MHCPRCQTELVVRDGGRLACDGCRGVFIRRGDMTALSRAIAASPDGFSAAAGPYRAPATPPSDATIAPDPVTYLRCPLCGEPMNRTRALSDLKMVVDRCLADGVWFDEGELGRAVAHVTKQRGSDEWARAIAAMLDGVLSARET